MSKTCSKKELAKIVAKRTGLTIEKTIEVVQELLNEISEQLISHNRVEFRDFGVFTVKEQKERTARNIGKDGSKMIVPKRNVVKFKVGKLLKKAIGETDTRLQ